MILLLKKISNKNINNDNNNNDNVINNILNNNNDLEILNFKKLILITHISNLKQNLIENFKYINNIQNKWKSFSLIKFLLKNGNTKFNEISSIDRAPKIENHKEFLKNINNLYNNLISNEDLKMILIILIILMIFMIVL